MLLAMLIALQLVQANDFVAFEVCYLDTMASPWELRPHPEGQRFYVRPNEILHVSQIQHSAEGADCVRVCAAHGCNYVVGTIASVMATLRGTENASP